MSNYQENIENKTATVAEEALGDMLLPMTTVATTTVGIFFSLRAMDVGQHDSMLTSTSSVWLLSRSIWER